MRSRFNKGATMTPQHSRILILGAGSGGIAVAARLRRALGPGQITVVEPATTHYYQPLWTLVGAGLVRKEKTKKPMAEVIPKGVTWLQDRVALIDAAARRVRCGSGAEISYDVCVV